MATSRVLAILAMAFAAACGGGGGDLPPGGAEIDGTVEGMTIDDAHAAFYTRAETPTTGLLLLGPQIGACGVVEGAGYQVILGMPCALASGTTFAVEDYSETCPTAWVLVEEGIRDVLGGRSGEIAIETFGDTVTGSFSAMVADIDGNRSLLEGRFNAIRCVDEELETVR